MVRRHDLPPVWSGVRLQIGDGSKKKGWLACYEITAYQHAADVSKSVSRILGQYATCLEIVDQVTLVDVSTAYYSQQDVCTQRDRSETVVKLRAAINMSVSPHFAQDSCATSRSSKLRHIDLGHLMLVVRRFYAGICAHLLSSISIASDAHCDGLTLSSSYEMTCPGSDSISGLVLKPFDPVRINHRRRNPKEQKGESTRGKQKPPAQKRKPREQ